MSENFYYLVYTSRISTKASLQASTFMDILTTANRVNAITGICGFLFFKNGRFLQYIEGDEMAIANLYYHLENDKRHRDLKTIVRGTRPRKVFNQWAMHCIDLDNDASAVFGDLLDDFATYDWSEADALQLVGDMQRYYGQTHDNSTPFDPKPVPYWQMLGKAIAKRHHIFLLVEGGILLLIILSYLLWQMGS